MLGASKPKRVLSAQEKRQWERVVLDLNAIFPSMSLQELATFVREADGSFDTALTLIMTANDAKSEAFAPCIPTTSISAASTEPVPTRVELSYAPVSNAFFPTAPSTASVSVTTPSGDTATPQPNDMDTSLSLDFNKEADLGRLRSKYGKHLPNIKSVLGEGVSDEYTILTVLEKTKGDTQEAVLVLLSMPEDVPRSELSSSRDALRASASNFSNNSSLKVSSGIEELPINIAMNKLNPSPLSATLEVEEEAVSEAALPDNEEEQDEVGDDDAWLVDPELEEVRKEIFGNDFVTQMLQQEYDALLARDLAKALESGLPEYAVWYPDEYKRETEAQAKEKKKIPLWAQHLDAAPPVKKQEPSGPKYWAPIDHIASSSEAPKRVIPEPDIDRKALQEFMEAHPAPVAPVVTTPPVHPGRQTRNPPPPPPRRVIDHSNDPLPVVARRDEAISIAYVIKQLRQLYTARIASVSPVSVKEKRAKKEAVLAAEVFSQAEATQAAASAVKEEAPAAPALFDIAAHLSQILDSALPKTTDQCMKIQHDEMVALRRELGERLLVSESVPTVLSLALSEPSFEVSRPTGIANAKGSSLTTTVHFRNPLALQLVVALSPLYPDISPTISIRTMSPSCPIPEADLTRLEQHLRLVVKETFGKPGLSALLAHAELWLCEDVGVRKAALLDFKEQNSTGDGFYEANIFTGLHHIFDFETEYSILHVNDVLNQRLKLLKRGIAFLVNAITVINPDSENPIRHPGQRDNSPFPVRNQETGELDEEASLAAIGLSLASVRVILQHYNWNLGKLSPAYLNCLVRGTYDTFLSEAGVAPIADRSAMEQHLPQALTAIIECPACLDSRPFHAMFGLVCGHMLCKSCYAEYVDYEVSRGVGLSSLSCPSPGCKYIVDQVSLAGLLGPARWNQYVNMAVSQYVQANPALRWCPSHKGCENVIQIGAIDQDGISAVLAGLESSDKSPAELAAVTPLVVQCKCSYTFCSSCARVGGHFPATCSECEFWDKIHPSDEPIRDHNIDNMLSQQFIASHTRQCPSCGANISKNGGCVHMLCTACRHEFCWVCMGGWRPSHYACSEQSIRMGDGVDITMKNYKSYDSLLARHRSFQYSAINHLKPKVIAAMYREDKKAKMLPTANAINAAHLKMDRPITLEDVPNFLEALDTLYLAHYLITNACKAGFALENQNVSTKSSSANLISLIHRGLEDLNFLVAGFQPDELKKRHIHHVNAGQGALVVSLKLIVSHLNEVRLSHLAQLATTRVNAP